jgi:hypothetical protein
MRHLLPRRMAHVITTGPAPRLAVLSCALRSTVASLMLALLCLLAPAVAGQTLPTAGGRLMLVVVHPDFKASTLTRGELAALFLRTRDVLSDATPVRVLDSADPVQREQFYQAVAGRSGTQMHAYWSRMVFSGAGRPPPQFDTLGLLAQVRGDTTAMAYVPAGSDVRGARVLLVLELP